MSAPLVLPSELTIFTVGEWRPQLLDWLLAETEPEPCLSVDAQGLGELDGAGVQVLLALARTLGDRGRTMQITGAGPAAANALRQLGAQALMTGAEALEIAP